MLQKEVTLDDILSILNNMIDDRFRIVILEVRLNNIITIVKYDKETKRYKSDNRDNFKEGKAFYLKEDLLLLEWLRKRYIKIEDIRNALDEKNKTRLNQGKYIINLNDPD
jgi:hypothetical protein